MIEKRKYPCGRECLVWASCSEPCDEYRAYLELAYRQAKYHCFEIEPPPPTIVRELVTILLHPQGNYELCYLYDHDSFRIANQKEELLVFISAVRKKPNLHSHSTLPEKLKELVCRTRK